jgi:hypothetical protein
MGEGARRGGWDLRDRKEHYVVQHVDEPGDVRVEREEGVEKTE